MCPNYRCVIKSAEPLPDQSVAIVVVIRSSRRGSGRGSLYHLGNIMALSVCLIAFIGLSSAMEVNVCDCSQPTFDGAIDLGRFGSCDLDISKGKERKINYAEYRHESESRLLKGMHVEYGLKACGLLRFGRLRRTRYFITRWFICLRVIVGRWCKLECVVRMR